MAEQSNNRNVALAGVAGALIGAGVAMAATKYMSDQGTRDRIKGTIRDVKDQVLETMDTTSQVNKKGGRAKKTAKKTTEKTITQKKAGGKPVEETTHEAAAEVAM